MSWLAWCLKRYLCSDTIEFAFIPANQKGKEEWKTFTWAEYRKLLVPLKACWFHFHCRTLGRAFPMSIS